MQSAQFLNLENGLRAIVAEWNSGDELAVRVDHVRGTPGGLNDPFFLQPGATVFDDGMEDVIRGTPAIDLLFINETDSKQTDLDLVTIV